MWGGKNRLFALIILLFTPIFAISQDYCLIDLKNGNSYLANVSDIDSITFTNIVEARNISEFESSGGLINLIKTLIGVETSDLSKVLSTFHAYINPIDGRISNDDSWVVTNPILLHKGDKVEVENLAGGYPNIGLTNSNSISINDYVEPVVASEYIADKDIYIVFSGPKLGKINCIKLNAVNEKANKEALDNLAHIVDNTICHSRNLFDINKLGMWGEWCNYDDGLFESNHYVVNYAHSDFIEIDPNRTYSRNGIGGICFFDKNKKFLAGTSLGKALSPNDAQYAVINVCKEDNYLQTMFIQTENDISNSDVFIPFGYQLNTNDRIVTIGKNGDFNTIKEGFEYAYTNGLPVMIYPGVYDLVEEGINGEGYMLPPKVFGYGAVLECYLPEEDWTLSPVNISTKVGGSEIYGLTIKCKNCRYCIHDDMDSFRKEYYHNVFKDLTLIHESEPNEILKAPQCIGGGFGNCGYVEIDNCIFECKHTSDVAYHTKSGGEQTRNCTLKCTNSVFSQGFGIEPQGTSTSFMNTIYISNCASKRIISNLTKKNIRIVSWNNTIA